MPRKQNYSIVLGVATCLAFILHIKNKRLRREIKKIKRSKKKGGNSEEQTKSSAKDEDGFFMNEIGIISSPYPQRAGTPRQGLLAEHSRSILTIHDSIAKECLDDLEQYSHVWVIFKFHLNPIGKGKNKKATQPTESSLSSSSSFTASKIKPPRAGGKKVGVLATRSPHRPNNVGLSLAMVEEVTTANVTVVNGKNKEKIRKKTIVKLLGLDLVDGTPVYDLKPYIPSDIVSGELRAPSWVVAEDKLQRVEWTEEARNYIKRYRKKGLLEPLYSKFTDDNTEDEVIQAISEIVGQDPRAQHEGRGDVTKESDLYEITFATLRVKFQVENTPALDGHQAKIMEVFQDEGDVTARPGSYQHSLGLRRKAEREAEEKGVKISWKYPVREGNTSGLFDVKK